LTPVNARRLARTERLPNSIREVGMAQTMKAAVVRQLGKPLVIEELPIPTPGHGEVLVKIRATGVCHTDVHAADGDWPVKPTAPFIPGHEGAGIVVALGPGVTRLKSAFQNLRYKAFRQIREQANEVRA
jgi:hypothetical protein